MRVFIVLAAAAVAGSAYAQQGAPWQGEWGAFTGAHAEAGRRLSISKCNGNTCNLDLEVRSANNNGGTASVQSLTLQPDGTATASLPDGDKKNFCTLRFQLRKGALPSVDVTSTGAVCSSYYATSPAITFDGNYPRKSAQPYTGMHVDECFLGTSAALLATCTHPELSAMERQWQDLAADFPLHPAPAPAGRAGSPVMQLDRVLLASCDGDAHPEACLSQRFTREIQAMQAKQTAFVQGTVERGDPAIGGLLARKIAGHYRNTTENGDVQGRSYKTTDTLTITPVGAASIHFDATLNFFNGHECSLSGGALYRRDGSFVFDDKAENANPPYTPACRLAIVPSESGISFKDLNGGCKNYCGARGGWNGAGFTFAQRAASPASPTRK